MPKPATGNLKMVMVVCASGLILPLTPGEHQRFDVHLNGQYPLRCRVKNLAWKLELRHAMPAQVSIPRDAGPPRRVFQIMIAWTWRFWRQ